MIRSLNRRRLLRVGASGGAVAGAAAGLPLLLPRGGAASLHAVHQAAPPAGGMTA
jgi:hypothetical protein